MSDTSFWCKWGWHRKIEDRVLCEMSSGLKVLAAHCSHCGKCLALLDYKTQQMIRDADIRLPRRP